MNHSYCIYMSLRGLQRKQKQFLKSIYKHTAQFDQPSPTYPLE